MPRCQRENIKLMQVAGGVGDVTEETHTITEAFQPHTGTKIRLHGASSNDDEADVLVTQRYEIEKQVRPLNFFESPHESNELTGSAPAGFCAKVPRIGYSADRRHGVSNPGDPPPPQPSTQALLDLIRKLVN